MASGPCPSTMQVAAVVSVLPTWGRWTFPGGQWRPLTHVPCSATSGLHTTPLSLRRPGAWPWAMMPGLCPCRHSKDQFPKPVPCPAEKGPSGTVGGRLGPHLRSVGLGAEAKLLTAGRRPGHHAVHGPTAPV